jgi:phosphatidylglycerol---prolipoprotein diacylglyceryl transferase
MLPAIKLWGSYSLQLYPFFLGISLAFFFRNLFEVNQKENIFKSKVELFFVYLLLLSSAFIGARILFFLSLGEIFTSIFNPQKLISGGGLVFFGGYIFAFITLYLYSVLRGINVALLINFLPGAVYAHAIGRLGCFFAGCCHGDYCPLSFLDRWPTQLLEASFLIYLGRVLKRRINTGRSNIFAFYVLSYSVFRFLNEYLRGDDIRGKWILDLSTSQIVSMALILIFSLVYLKESFSTKSSDT